MLSLLLLLLFFLSLLPDLSTTLKTPPTEYLKLPLLHKTPFSSPSQSLSSDTHRLSSLFSSLHTHKTLKSPLISGASTGSGQYFVNLQIGTPPQNLLLVVDTGSDLIWVKCSPCKNCSNHSPNSSFLPRHSSSFSPYHCYDSPCRLIPHPSAGKCNHSHHLHSTCRYSYSYADGSFTNGFFSKETTTLKTFSGNEIKIRNLSFGCGFRISGPSVSGSSFNGARGVMGLGRGSISFSSQIGRRFGNIFSYCLMDYTLSPPPTSYLMIGGDRRTDAGNSSRISYTSLLFNPSSPTFYYIGVKSVFVNGVKLRINPSVWLIDEAGNGGTVVDSGTTLTFLAEPAYRKILVAFKRRVKLPIAAVATLGFDLCVNVSAASKVELPRLSFGLDGGALMSPPPRNYFIETEERVMCLAIRPVDSENGFSVIGNLMQQGFLLEFDRDAARLGFSRHGCAKDSILKH